jgi:hypothetical protein
MARYRIEVEGFEQMRHEAKPPDGVVMVANVVFTMTVDGKPLGTFRAPIEQTAGGDYGLGDIALGAATWPGKFSHDAFARAVVTGYRQCVRSQDRAIGTAPGATNIVMENNFLGWRHRIEFDA